MGRDGYERPTGREDGPPGWRPAPPSIPRPRSGSSDDARPGTGGLDAPRWSGRAIAAPDGRGRPPGPAGPKPGIPTGAVAERVGDDGHTGPLAVTDLDVLAAARGDRVAFAAIYDRYSGRLHDFCLGMVRDPHAAADCVQDTFCTAARRLHQLRDPDKLRPWLYAIARNEALRRIRARTREQAVEDVPERANGDVGPATLAGRYDLAALIGDAAGGLSERDRAVLELHYRHGLDGPELADALGVSHTAANTMVGRLRTTVERSLGALLVARQARQHPGRCVELDAVLGTWDGRLTVLMRKRIARHLEQCPACDASRRELVNPKALLASAPLFVPAPLLLRHHVLAGAAPHLHTAASTAANTAVHTAAAGSAATTSWWPAAKTGILAHAAHGLHAIPLTVAAPLAAVAIAVPAVVVGVQHSAPASPTLASVSSAEHTNSHRSASAARRTTSTPSSTTAVVTSTPTSTPASSPADPSTTPPVSDTESASSSASSPSSR